FKVNSGEYKLMGLAPYGEPRYAHLIFKHLIDLRDDGSFRVDLRYFNYLAGLTMTNRAFERVFGGPPRRPESRITQREMDLAASIQAVTEDVMLRTARYVHAQTGMKNLVMAGGVALNCVGNGVILREGPFENIWIQPAAGDAGGALGAALFVWNQLLDKPRRAQLPDQQQGSFLGPSYSDDEIAETLDRAGAVYSTCASDEQLCDEVSSLVANEKVVGWFQGRMEFGPRALGARSILGDARSEKMQSVMNLKIKFRESFRPFAPCVLREQVDRYFDVRPFEDSPYMLQVAQVRKELRTRLPSDYEQSFGIEKLNFKRSCVPAITHVDYSARLQTVDKVRNPLFHQLLTRFYEKTGCPVMINTSFNIRSEPIVCTPQDAYRCLLVTGMDALVMGRQIILREEQPQLSEQAKARHMAQFQLD
ncbi:MAG TPA: carbamoyltransferase C-terminal domain-containing protein, partial [Pirellulales bacterium]